MAGKPLRLSGFELEVLQQIFSRGTATAPEVHGALSESRTLSYSAVKTIFDRLERKGAIRREDQVGRTIVYAADVAEDRLRASLVRDFLSRVFPHGDRKPLFNALVRDTDLSPEEVQYLRNLLDEREQ